MFEQAFKNIVTSLPQRRGLQANCGLHRAKLLAPVPQVSRHSSATGSHGGRRARKGSSTVHQWDKPMPGHRRNTIDRCQNSTSPVRIKWGGKPDIGALSISNCTTHDDGDPPGAPSAERRASPVMHRHHEHDHLHGIGARSIITPATLSERTSPTTGKGPLRWQFRQSRLRRQELEGQPGLYHTGRRTAFLFLQRRQRS